MFWLWPRVQTVHGDGVHGTFVCVSFLCGCSVPLVFLKDLCGSYKVKTTQQSSKLLYSGNYNDFIPVHLSNGLLKYVGKTGSNAKLGVWSFTQCV